MPDESWKLLEEPWERLKWAREQRFETAKAFASSIGMKPGTYSNHEREPGSSRHAKLTAEKAMRFGDDLKVNWRWLFDGNGSPKTKAESIGARIARVAALMEQASEPDQQRIEVIVEALLSSGRR